MTLALAAGDTIGVTALIARLIAATMTPDRMTALAALIRLLIR
jgi:hypothetical protein